MWRYEQPLGLSIGTANLVATGIADTPITRHPVLTRFSGRAAEVGEPSRYSRATGSCVVLSGFVERIGDPVPLIAADGSTHRAENLLVEALEAMTRAAGWSGSISEVAIAVPAHWSSRTVRTLREAIRTNPRLCHNGIPPPLVPDAAAALTALHANPGLPERGIVALLDFGAAGTSITLADAASDFAPICETVRYPGFSGDRIDRALVTRVLSDFTRVDDVDPAAELLARLLEQCRAAKHRLSAEPSAKVVAELRGRRRKVVLRQADFESLIDDPLRDVISKFKDILGRNKIDIASLAAIGVTGGGAAIPLVTRRVYGSARVPTVTTSQPMFDAAAGAALWDTAVGTGRQRVHRSLDDTAPNPLAGSQDGNSVGSGSEATVTTGRLATTGTITNESPWWERRPESPPWYRRGRPLLAGLALIALIAGGGLTYRMAAQRDGRSAGKTPGPVTLLPVTRTESPAAEPAPDMQDDSAILTSPVPSPSTSPRSITVAAPTTTTTTTTIATTTAAPSTATTTTASPASPTTTPTTTTAPTTTTNTKTPVMTTARLRIPYLPFPIPIPIPVNP